jgi:DNA-nicking Smr family endonuclease
MTPPEIDSLLYTAQFDASIPMLDIHGHTLNTALPDLDAFLHSAFMRSDSVVCVVYGAGTGRLRDAVLSYLQSQKELVAGMREADRGGMVCITLHRAIMQP